MGEGNGEAEGAGFARKVPGREAGAGSGARKQGMDGRRKFRPRPANLSRSCFAIRFLPLEMGRDPAIGPVRNPSFEILPVLNSYPTEIIQNSFPLLKIPVAGPEAG
ncbi:hypothetical protein B4135_4138 [Caldibacillus debilis]|uniref:Uncharacterized protein n=1 Tax=Caldibacillus debilis TaxID=301148 RepID=A0A150L7W7_9BACI|nr:hypothetical protein B4135_4138 [Caldibacillus debilis]